MKIVARGMALWLIVAVSLIGFGCSKAPSDEEVLRAIDESGILKQGGFTVTAPVTIVEKGRKQADGSWPVKVKLTMAMKMMDGQEKTIEKIAEFKIFQFSDKTGTRVWKARL